MSPITSGQGMAWRHNATFMFHTKRVCEVFAASRQISTPTMACISSVETQRELRNSLHPTLHGV
ncbi:MAG TPA: hypothetical protein PLQ23_13595, partial [Dermatophilaceae bacterium]|nr:hypothetical protein [Dermatophilaceae bacterium]